MVAAGALSSLAQSNVYSVNVVGYINIDIAPGFNLISSPLQAQVGGVNNNGVNVVLGNMTPVFNPPSGGLFQWNATTGNGFLQTIFPAGDGTWVDGSFNLATNQIPPGIGFFIQNGTTNNTSQHYTLTLTGSVVQGTNNFALNGGLFGFLGDPEPISGDITTNGFPVQDNSTVLTWNVAQQKYNQAVFGLSATNGGPGFVDGFFNPVVVAPAVGQGFLYHNPTNTIQWTRSFIVQ
jgi:hypothetical protein